MAGLAFESFGVRIGVRVNDATLLPKLSRFLPPGRKPLGSLEVDHLHSFILGGPGARPGIRRFHVVYADADVTVKTHELRVALDELEADLRLTVAMHTRRRLFVHAGAVGIRGGVLMLPASSESGKSTLVRDLIAAGARYYSDEYAVLDPHGRVHPYALDLSLDPAPGEQAQRFSATEMGAEVAREPAPVRLVLATRYRAGARFRPRLLTPARGALAILAHVVQAQVRPRSTFLGMTRLVQKVPVFASDRPDTESVIDWLCREGWFDRAVRRVGDATEATYGEAHFS